MPDDSPSDDDCLLSLIRSHELLNRRTILTSIVAGTSSTAGCLGLDSTSGSNANEEDEEGQSPDQDPDTTKESAVDTTLSVDEDSFATGSVIIEEFDANADGRLDIRWDGETHGSVQISADESLTNFEFTFSENLVEEQILTVRFVPRGADEPAETVEFQANPVVAELTPGEVQLIDAQPAGGFAVPYFVYIPEQNSRRDSGPIFVSPNNTEERTDALSDHIGAARDYISSESGVARSTAAELGLPLLVPTFPRPDGSPARDLPYTHRLDRETLEIDGETFGVSGISEGDLNRIDKQLLAMIDHFRASLAQSLDYDSPPEVHMDGFGAAGNFTNRFTALHPDRVACATAGGINGTAILPVREYDGRTLRYQVGITDLEDLTGSTFDRNAWQETPQFLYLGAEDESDTIPSDTAWNPELRELALEVYGRDMQKDRMSVCREVYERAEANAQLPVYEHTGHEVPNWIRRDIYQFHNQHIRSDEFRPIRVRNGDNIGLKFAERPAAGDTEVTVSIDISEYLLELGQPFSDGSLSIVADTGDSIGRREREFTLSGPTSITKDDLPAEQTRTFELDRSLNAGDELTFGIVDGEVVTEVTTILRAIENRLGATHVGSKYRFHADEYDIVNEGAAALENVGSRVFKGWSYGIEKQYPFHDWPEFDSQVEVFRSDPFRELLNREFNAYVFNSTAYTSGAEKHGWGYFVSRFNQDHETEVVQSYERLTRYLLETYDGTGIEIVLSNWEGDWLLAGGGGKDGPIDPDTLQRAKRWWSARQRGIERARQAVESDVAVLHAVEINRVLEAREDGINWIVNTILPDLPVDLVAYSAWDLCATAANMSTFETDGRDLVSNTLSYIENQSPNANEYVKSVYGANARVVFPSEYGLPIRQNGIDESMRATRVVTEEALDWGSPYVLFWQTYDNEVIIDGEVVSLDPRIEQRLESTFENGPGLDDVMGFYLIRPDGARASTWYYFAEQLETNEEAFTRLELRYDSLRLESDINPDIPEEHARKLGLACFRMGLVTSTEEYQFDIGDLRNEPAYKRGVYEPGQWDTEQFRWFGGIEDATTIYIPTTALDTAEEIEAVSITGQPVEGGINAEVYIDGKYRDSLSVDDGRGRYTIDL